MRWKLLRRRLSVSAPRMTVRSHLPWPIRWAVAALALGFSAALALWAFEFGKGIAGLDRDDKVELIELADFKIPAQVAAGVPLEEGERDDFPSLVPRIEDPKVVGIILGTPVYFGNMSALCKAFLDRCIAFRKNNFSLSGKVAGVLAVGGNRNGGQELTLQSIHVALMSHQLIIVGDGTPTAHWGGTLWNQANDDISQDELGLSTARNLGKRVAEVALQFHTP